MLRSTGRGMEFWAKAVADTESKVLAIRCLKQAAMRADVAVMSLVHGVERECLCVVADLLCHLSGIEKDTQHRDPVACVASWTDHIASSQNGDDASAKAKVSAPAVVKEAAMPPRRHVRLSLAMLLKEVHRLEGLQGTMNVVADVLLQFESSGDVKDALSRAILSDAVQEAERANPFAFSSATPVSVTPLLHHEQRPFLDRNYAPPSSVWQMLNSMRLWHDPRESRIFTSLDQDDPSLSAPGHGEVADAEESRERARHPVSVLIHDCKVILSRHAGAAPEEAVVPVYAFAHEMVSDVVFALWAPHRRLNLADGPVKSREAHRGSTAPHAGDKSHDALGSAWEVVSECRAMHADFTRRRSFSPSLDLSAAGANELRQVLARSDARVVGDALVGGRWGAGQLPFVMEVQGASVFKLTLPDLMTNGQNELYVVHYRVPDGMQAGVFIDSVAWLPPPLEAFDESSPFCIRNLPPPAVMEYIASRPQNEALHGQGWMCRSVLSDHRYDAIAEFAEACSREPNVEATANGLLSIANELIGNDWPQFRHALHGVWWRPRVFTSAVGNQNACKMWLAITREEAAKLATELITSDEYAITWQPVATEEEGRSRGLGDAWLTCLCESFDADRDDLSVTFVFSDCLCLVWSPEPEHDGQSIDYQRMTTLSCNPPPPAPSQPASRRSTLQKPPRTFVQSSTDEVPAPVPSSSSYLKGLAIPALDEDLPFAGISFTPLGDKSAFTRLSSSTLVSPRRPSTRDTPYKFKVAKPDEPTILDAVLLARKMLEDCDELEASASTETAAQPKAKYSADGENCIQAVQLEAAKPGMKARSAHFLNLCRPGIVSKSTASGPLLVVAGTPSDPCAVPMIVAHAMFKGQLADIDEPCIRDVCEALCLQVLSSHSTDEIVDDGTREQHPNTDGWTPRQSAVVSLSGAKMLISQQLSRLGTPAVCQLTRLRKRCDEQPGHLLNACMREYRNNRLSAELRVAESAVGNTAPTRGTGGVMRFFAKKEMDEPSAYTERERSSIRGGASLLHVRAGGARKMSLTVPPHAPLRKKHSAGAVGLGTASFRKQKDDTKPRPPAAASPHGDDGVEFLDDAGNRAVWCASTGIVGDRASNLSPAGTGTAQAQVHTGNTHVVGGWKLSLKYSTAFIPANDAALDLHGWLHGQLRPFAYYLAKSLSLLPPLAPSKSVQPPTSHHAAVVVPTLYRAMPSYIQPQPGPYAAASGVAFHGFAACTPSLRAAGGTPPPACEKAVVLSLRAPAARAVHHWSRDARALLHLLPPGTAFQVTRAEVTTRTAVSKDTGSAGEALWQGSSTGDAEEASKPGGKVKSQAGKVAGMLSLECKLTENSPSECLLRYVRETIAKIAHEKSSEHTRQLFQILQNVEKKDFSRALALAASPLKSVFSDGSEWNERVVTRGMRIASELIQFLLQDPAAEKRGTVQTVVNDSLAAAVVHKKFGSIARLCALGADVETDVSEGWPLIHAAAGSSCLETLREVLRLDADTSVLSAKGDTVLHTVVSAFESFPDPRLLIDVAGRQLNVRGSRGSTALHCAVEREAMNMVRVLLEIGADPNVPLLTIGVVTHEPASVELSAFDGDFRESHRKVSVQSSPILSKRACRSAAVNTTPLHSATVRGLVEVVDILLTYGADPEFPNANGQCALHLAVSTANFGTTRGLEVLSRLATEGAVRASDKAKVTALHFAASLGNLDAVHVILQAPGASDNRIIDMEDRQGLTPLHAAALLFEIDVVLFLAPLSAATLTPSDFPKNKVSIAGPLLVRALEDGDVDKSLLLLNCGVSTEETSLFLLAGRNPSFSNEEGVKVIELLVTPAALEARGQDGRTALHVAVQERLVATCKAMLLFGADPNAQDTRGRTALHLAAEDGNIEMMYVLLWADRLSRRITADPNARDHNGMTPLHVAAERGWAEIASLLVEEGVSTSCEDNNGFTALHVASIHQRLEIVHLLRGGKKEVGQLPYEHARRMLFDAINAGQVADVLRLLDSFMLDLTMTDDNGCPALLAAAHTKAFDFEGNTDLVARLSTPEVLNCRIDLPAVGRSVTALHIAAYYDRHHIVSALLTLGADPRARTADDLLPIVLAARELNSGAVTVLLPLSGYELMPLDFPVAPLHRSVRAGDLDAVRMLLEHGIEPCEADPFAGNPSGRLFVSSDNEVVGVVPLHSAVGRPEFATRCGLALFEKLVTDATVNARTLHKQQTPLHCCAFAWHDSSEMAQILLDRGADPDKADVFANTALHLACSRGHLKLIRVLEPLTAPCDIDGMAELRPWLNCEVMVQAPAAKVELLCKQYIQAAEEAIAEEDRASGDTRGTRLVPPDVLSARWSAEKLQFVGKVGTPLIVRSGYVKVAFPSVSSSGDAAEAAPSYVVLPRTAVTRLLYQQPGTTASAGLATASSCASLSSPFGLGRARSSKYFLSAT
ncbi:hypothetical protein DIPPA_34971 [Diplonema papillatum]|nr:hypothetical protein DIPPA_34971 [Diplonema papillatum]